MRENLSIIYTNIEVIVKGHSTLLAYLFTIILEHIFKGGELEKRFDLQKNAICRDATLPKKMRNKRG